MTYDPGCLNGTPDDPMSDEDIYEANVREYDALVDELNFGHPSKERSDALLARMLELEKILEPAT